MTLGQFPLPVYVNQPPGFKRLHHLKHGVLVHLKFENL